MHNFISVPLNPASRKFVRFLWSGNRYEFLCLCFGLSPASRIFTKLLKIPVSVASPEHTNYNLLGRHVVDRPYNRRNVNGQRHSNLPSSTTRVCAEFKEISVDTYTDNRVLRGDSRFINYDSVSTREESQKQCQELLQKKQVSI